MLENFKTNYQLTSEPIIPSEEIIQQYQSKVPDFLIEIWKTSGLGKYNDGLIELVNPKEYEPSLWTWLGKEVSNYVPFAITGFGELFYYRKLTETDEDVCIVDIQYRKIATMIWSMEAFFEDFLINEENRDLWLRQALFTKAIAEKGVLSIGEVFTFVPALVLGGGEELENLQKGNAKVYQDLIFQMTS
jgi:hypothetical protein